MEILGHASGRLEKHLRREKDTVAARIRAAIMMQKGTLIYNDFDELCYATTEEFCECIEKLKHAIAICDLSAHPDTVPAMIMIPDGLVSLTRKMGLVSASGELEGIDVDRCAVKMLEPYAVINVRFLEVARAGALLAQFYRDNSSFKGELPLTLSETVMHMLYTPEAFDGYKTAVIDPVMERLVVVEGSLFNVPSRGPKRFHIRTYGADEMPVTTWKVRVPVCDLRIKR